MVRLLVEILSLGRCSTRGTNPAHFRQFFADVHTCNKQIGRYLSRGLRLKVMAERLQRELRDSSKAPGPLLQFGRFGPHSVWQGTRFDARGSAATEDFIVH